MDDDLSEIPADEWEPPSYQWIILAALSALIFTGAAIPALNLVAMIDLGLDATQEGRREITVWVCVLLMPVASGIVLAALAMTCWLRFRKTDQPPA